MAAVGIKERGTTLAVDIDRTATEVIKALGIILVADLTSSKNQPESADRVGLMNADVIFSSVPARIRVRVV